MNSEKGKDDKSGKPGAGPAGAEGKPAGGAGAPGGGGKDDKCAGGKDDKCAGGPPGKGAAGPGKAESPGKGSDEPKGLQKIFDLYSKSGGMGGGGSGLSKENGKKWLTAAGLLDEKTGCGEKDFDAAFDKAAKGEKSLDFCGFKELIECISKEKKKEPKEFFDKLVSAGPPKDAK